MQTIHHPPAGETMIEHGREECACKPQKTLEHKRRRDRQGYNVVTHYWHHPMPEPDEEEESPRVRDEWDEADDLRAARKEDPDNW